MEAYTLKKHQDTEELHLFQGEITKLTPRKCNSKPASICGKMEKPQSEKNIFTCLTEQEARDQSAKLGRKVCGVCVSHLYADF